MSTELEPKADCLTGDVSLTRYWGGTDNGTCVQLTFKKPEHERGKLDYGYWYIQLSREQAAVMGQRLRGFAAGES